MLPTPLPCLCPPVVYEPVSLGCGGRAVGEHSSSGLAQWEGLGGLTANTAQAEQDTGVKGWSQQKNGWYEEAGDKSRLERSEQFLPVWQALLSFSKGGFGGFLGAAGTL